MRIKIKGLEIEARECRGIEKVIGLMFSGKNAKARVFKFKNKGMRAIHSLFCPVFLAIWLENKKIIGFKIVRKWKLSIKPEKEFDTLIEVPISKKYKDVAGRFLVG